MKVDFLGEGSIDCPIIRLYNGQSEDYDKLIDSINNLVNYGIKFDVLKLEGFEHDYSINSLVFREKERKENEVIEFPNGIFHCYWSKTLLLNIIERLKNHQKDQDGYYWFDDNASGIDVLLSGSGRW